MATPEIASSRASRVSVWSGPVERGGKINWWDRWVSCAGSGNLTPTTFADPCASWLLRPARLPEAQGGGLYHVIPTKLSLSTTIAAAILPCFGNVRSEHQTQRTRTCVLAGTSVRDQVCQCRTWL